MHRHILRGEMFFHQPQLPVKVLHRNPEIPFSLHTHDFYELVVIASGGGKHLQKEGASPLRGGDIFLIRPGTYHGYGAIEDLELYNILFAEQVLHLHLPELQEITGFTEIFLSDHESVPIIRLNDHQLAEVLQIVQTIQTESNYLHSAYGSGAFVYAKLMQLIVSMCRIHSEHRSSTPVVDERLERVIAHMEEHLDRSIPLDELASVAAMSTSTLNRHFKRATGWSPVDFHIHRRIIYAARLLLSTDLSIELISDRTGFSDGNYFARQFRTHMQMSPREYKQLWTKAVPTR